MIDLTKSFVAGGADLIASYGIFGGNNTSPLTDEQSQAFKQLAQEIVTRQQDKTPTYMRISAPKAEKRIEQLFVKELASQLESSKPVESSNLDLSSGARDSTAGKIHKRTGIFLGQGNSNAVELAVVFDPNRAPFATLFACSSGPHRFDGKILGQQLASLQNEAEMLRQFENQKEFLTVFDSYPEPAPSPFPPGTEKIATITEYCEQHLGNYLQQLDVSTASEEQQRELTTILHGVLQGLVKMQKSHIVHGEIEPSHILLKASPEGPLPKISGLKAAHEEGVINLTDRSRVPYTSPEVLGYRSMTAADKRTAMNEYRNTYIRPLRQQLADKGLGLQEKKEVEGQIERHEKRLEALYLNPYRQEADAWAYGLILYEILFKTPFYESILAERNFIFQQKKITEDQIKAKAPQLDLGKIRDHLDSLKVKTPFERKLLLFVRLALNPDPLRLTAKELDPFFCHTFDIETTKPKKSESDLLHASRLSEEFFFQKKAVEFNNLLSS